MSNDHSDKTDRQLLEEICRRLKYVETDMAISFKWMKEVALTRERVDVADQIDRHIEMRANGQAEDG